MKKLISRTMAVFFIIVIIFSSNYKINASTSVDEKRIQVNTPVIDNLSTITEDNNYVFSLSNPGSVYISFSHDTVNDMRPGWEIVLIDKSTGTNVNILDEVSINCDNYTTRKVRLPSGDFYIKVYYHDYGGYYGDFLNIDYKLTINYTDESAGYFEKEWNDNIDSASIIDANKQYTGNLFSENDVDYYKFNLKNSGNVNISFLHDTLQDCNEGWEIVLIDKSTGSAIVLLDEVSKNTENFKTSNIRLPSGDYYIRICYRDYGWYYGDFSNIDYKLTINYTDESTGYFEKEWNDDVNSASFMDVNKQYTGNLFNENDVDFYKFSLKNPANLRINFMLGTVQDHSGGWEIVVYNRKSGSLISNLDEVSEDIENYNTNKIKLLAGDYYIKIFYHDSYNVGYSYIDYRLTVKSTPISIPKAPANLKISISGVNAKLSWTSAENSNYYKVYYKKAGGNYKVLSANNTNKSISNLKRGSKYYFKVAAVNEAGQGAYSKEISKVIENK